MSQTRFRNLASRQIDQALATKRGVPVEIEADPPFTIYVRQHGGAHRRSEWVAAQLYVEMGVADLEGPERYEALRNVEIETAARELVADWEGAVGEDGEPIPCTPDAVRELLTDFPDVLQQVIAASQDEGRFRLAATRKSDPGAG